MRIMLIYLSFFVLLSPTSALASARSPESGGPLEFLVVLPGRTDGEQLAAGTKGLARWLSNCLDGMEVRGRICSTYQAARAALEAGRPAFALVDLVFYVETARSLGLKPIASTRPGGFDADFWRLLVPAEAVGGRLSGDVEGTMLFSSRAAACLILPGVHGDIVRLVGVVHPAEAVRRAAAGEISGVVLDRIQYAAAGALPGFDRLEVKHATEALPTPPVVWLGKGGELADRVAKALLSMGGDPSARQTLRQLGMTGFGPSDPALRALAQGCLE